MKRSVMLLAALVSLVALTTAGAAVGHPGQHGTDEGHLLGTGEWGNVDLVSSLRVHDAEEGLISDVGALGNHAYLGNYGRADCEGPETGGQRSPDGGVYIVNISDPEKPREVGFIPAHQDTYVSEGVQVVRLTTSRFTGRVLVMNQEGCGKNYKAGTSLYDVTNPRRPTKLAENFGDFRAPDGSINAPHDANETHSAFIWDAGAKAYVVTVDDVEQGIDDVDIFDITNPKRPRHIAEVGLQDWPEAQDPLALGEEVFLHDMVVKKIDGHWRMLLSYWDAGWIVLDVDDPANPVYLDDFDYPTPDTLTGYAVPEGNAHQAEWSHNNRFIVGTDEDFSPYRTTFRITSGPNAGVYDSGQFGWTVPIIDKFEDGTLNGPTVYGGLGCPGDPVPDPSVLGDLGPDEESILVLQRGICFFSEKVETAQNAGYDAVLIPNHHNGSGYGEFPDAPFCGSQGHEFEITISAMCLGHRAFHLLFNTEPSYLDTSTTEPAYGALGQDVSATSQFDGWGYVRLLDATTLEEIDSYAIPEALDIDFASGYGDLSVHEVATDPHENLGYLSYYSGGLRVIRFSSSGITEVGGYLSSRGNNFWGVEVWRHPATGEEYVLASDRDSGLWIFDIE